MGTHSRTRILLVEDDVGARAMLDEALHFLGYGVVSELDGEAALVRAESQDFDVLVTDHEMPGLDGLGLVRALRARGFGGPVFVISGSLTPELRAEYERLGVTGFANKPVDLMALHRLLRSAPRPTMRVGAAGPHPSAF